MGAEYTYRVKLGGRAESEPAGRDETVERARKMLAGHPVGTDAVIERKPRHGERWDHWRRYAVHPDGGVVRVDR